jgi:uncharacterized protein (DUF58 family)
MPSELALVPGVGLFSGTRTPSARKLRAALLRARRRPSLLGPGSIVGRRGDGYEFVELRAYQAGDDPRRIDWAATARSGSLQTRIMLEENPLEIAAIVDASPSMRVGRTREPYEAAEESARAWFEMAETGDRTLRIGDGTSMMRALTIARRALRPSAALLVISDFHWVEDVFAFRDAAIALSRRLDVTALSLRDPWFDGLPLRGYVRVRDAESGETARLYIGARERARYRDAVARRERSLLELFAASGWRGGILDEREGRRSLYAAFGLA